jgi:hypothetical protein
MDDFLFLPSGQSTAESAFLLPGQVLEHRYGFGVSLGLGNLSAGRLRRLFGREERSLVVLTVMLLTSITLFMLVPLPRSYKIKKLVSKGFIHPHRRNRNNSGSPAMTPKDIQ